jgi:hypothetical protein
LHLGTPVIHWIEEEYAIAYSKFKGLA